MTDFLVLLMLFFVVNVNEDDETGIGNRRLGWLPSETTKQRNFRKRYWLPWI